MPKQETRQQKEARHLLEITTQDNLRAKVERILVDGRSHGYSLIIHNALRTKEVQEQKVAAGNSKTKTSKHLAGKDGKSRAADIVDERYMWQNVPQHVWVMIGRLALSKGLNWGGLWGLPVSLRAKFVDFLTDTSKPFNAKGWVDAEGKPNPIGWDPAHVEAKNK